MTAAERDSYAHDLDHHFDHHFDHQSNDSHSLVFSAGAFDDHSDAQTHDQHLVTLDDIVA
jgi:hypothetical protein